MSRNVTAIFKRAAFAQTTPECPVILLEIDHPTLSVPIRVCHNSEDVISNGDTYIAFPFLIDMPADRDDEIPRVTLTIDNIDRSIIQALREITSEPSVEMSIVLAGTPDDIEAGPFPMTLREITYDVWQIQGYLSYEPILDEPFPGDAFTPNYFPGLYNAV